MRDENTNAGSAALGFALGSLVMAIVACVVGDGKAMLLQKEAVKRGFMEYHPQTGVLQWREQREGGAE